MSGHGTTTAVALTSIRVSSFLMLGYALFYLAMSLGKWYDDEVVVDDLQFTLNGDVEIRSSSTQKFLFLGIPIMLAASFGGIYEAIWKHGELNARKVNPGDGTAKRDDAGSYSKAPGAFSVLKKAVNYKFWPLGRFAPCLTVGEACILFLWLLAMGARCWQGTLYHGSHYYSYYGRCRDNLSKWCSTLTGEVGPTPTQYR